jgi:hypothetical protein
MREDNGSDCEHRVFCEKFVKKIRLKIANIDVFWNTLKDKIAKNRRRIAQEAD